MPTERAGLHGDVPGYARVEMPTITVLLDSRQLENPDLDLRYAIPELLSDRSDGLIRDGGYDYETDHVLALYLQVDDAEAATELIEMVLREVVILNNHLAGRFTLRSEP